MSPDPAKTPRELGYRTPAEWEPHAATWLSWPDDELTWPGKVRAAGQAMARWVREIVRERPGALPERAEILVQDEGHAALVRGVLEDWQVDLARVGLHVCENNGSWVRDFGPTFLVRDAGPDALAAVCWEFDSWGGKGEAYYGERAGLDALVAGRIASLAGAPVFRPGIVLEGGGIEVNGRGTFLATTHCLLESRARTGSTASERRDVLERTLADHLGVSHFLWLDGVLFEGDDTDGHVDNLARFVGPGTVLTVVADDKSDPHYEPLKQNLRALRAMTDQDGKQLEVIELPLPAPQRLRSMRDGRPQVWRYPASYANFYIANGCVLVPTYADACDLAALEQIQSAFPDRPVIGMDCCDFILGQGAIHCSTQQQPAVPVSNPT